MSNQTIAYGKTKKGITVRLRVSTLEKKLKYTLPTT
jgi:hypothetical protein